MKFLFILHFAVLFFVSCKQSNDSKDLGVLLDSTSLSPVVVDDIVKNDLDESIKKLMIPIEKSIEGFKIKVYYINYDKDEFDNPSILEVYKNYELIFSDSIKGYDEFKIGNLGYRELSGKKLFFNISYGTKACDYMQGNLHYFISEEEKVYFLDNFSTMFTDYAGKSLKIIFPEDTNGLINNVIKIENIKYFGGEEPNKSDTVFYIFDKNEFVKKEKNN